MSSSIKTCGECKFYHAWTKRNGRAGDCVYLASILLPRSVCWEDIDSSVCADDSAVDCLCSSARDSQATGDEKSRE